MAPAVEAGAGAGATASEADPPWPPEFPATPWCPDLGPPWRHPVLSKPILRDLQGTHPFDVVGRKDAPSVGRCHVRLVLCFGSPCAPCVPVFMPLFGFSCSCPRLGSIIRSLVSVCV